MTAQTKHHIPWYLWPFAGVLVSLTIIGAIVGVPLAIIGLLLLLRGIF